MAFPLLVPLAAGLAGAHGGSLASTALTSSGTSTTDSHNVQTTDSRAFNIQYPTYQVQIDSPLASQTTKKEASATSSSTPSMTQDASSGFDTSMILPVALILGAAYVGKELVK